MGRLGINTSLKVFRSVFDFCLRLVSKVKRNLLENESEVNKLRKNVGP